MNECKLLLNEGKKLLFSQKAHKAMNMFKNALEVCECENNIELGEILFYLGLAFKKMGHAGYARRCWLNAFQVRDIKNEENSQNAEWEMFHSIQLSRYLSQKIDFQFDTLAEGDMVHDLIKTIWLEMSTLPQLKSMSSDDRVNYYYTITIVFPEMNLKEVNGYFKKGKVVTFLQ